MRLINFIFCLFLILSSASNSYSQNQKSNTAVTDNKNSFEQSKKEFPYNIALQNADGIVFNSSKLFKKNKKATVLLFWLTTCGPCKLELTAISGKFNGWKKSADFDFYAISTDFSNRYDQFKTRVKESQWPFPAYFDMNRQFSTVMPGELNGLPQLFVIDKKGNIIYHTRKYQAGDEDKLFEVLKKA